jgi:hypothetical protein
LEQRAERSRRRTPDAILDGLKVDEGFAKTLTAWRRRWRLPNPPGDPLSGRISNLTEKWLSDLERLHRACAPALRRADSTVKDLDVWNAIQSIERPWIADLRGALRLHDVPSSLLGWVERYAINGLDDGDLRRRARRAAAPIRAWRAGRDEFGRSVTHLEVETSRERPISRRALEAFLAKHAEPLLGSKNKGGRRVSYPAEFRDVALQLAREFDQRCAKGAAAAGFVTLELTVESWCAEFQNYLAGVGRTDLKASVLWKRFLRDALLHGRLQLATLPWKPRAPRSLRRKPRSVSA